MSSNIIINNINPYTQITATAGQTVFDTTWTADVASDVLVYARASTADPDDQTQLVNPADYNVTFVGAQETVRVTFLVGRTAGDVISIVRDTPADRMNLYSNTNFTPTMLNSDFGRLTLMIQQNNTYNMQVTPHYNFSAIITNNVDNILPLLEPEQTWVKNAAGTAIIAADFPEGGAASKVDTFVTLTDETADAPNSFPLSAIGNGILVNDVSNTDILTRTLTGTGFQITVTNGDGLSGNPTFSIPDNPIMPGVGGMGIPEGTTAQRPGSPNGIGLRYNTDLAALEYYDGSTWVQLDDADLSQYLLLSGGTMTGDIDMGGNKVTNAAAPTANSDYATKLYVDEAVSLLEDPCVAATTGNLAGYTYSNGTAGVGATLTAGSNGAFSADGVSPSLNDRILVGLQTDETENGVYTLTQVGDASNPAILTRATDYDTPADMEAGDRFTVLNGTVYGGTQWIMTQTAAITIGTTDITFSVSSVAGFLVASNNLSDVDNAATSRQNLGLEIGVDVQEEISGATLTSATVATDDKVLIQDTNDSDNLKTVTAQSIADLAPATPADAVTYDVAQVGHGFSVGDWVYLNGTTYTAAQANAANTAEVVGVVSAVADADNFTLQMAGRVTGLSGLTAGDVYFLSESSAGDITSTEPTGSSNISKPVLVADTTTSGYIVNYRGVEADISNPAPAILQVVQSVYTTNPSTTSTSYVTSGLSASITPSSIASNVRVQVTSAAGNTGTGPQSVEITIYRGATPLTLSSTTGFAVARTEANDDLVSLNVDYIDSPSTTSSVTYTIYFKVDASTGYLGRRGVDTAFLIPTVITLTEIA